MRRLLALLVVAMPFAASAQQPQNPTCATAFVIPVWPTNVAPEFMYLSSSLLPTAVPDPVTACSGSVNRSSAWYRFTATATRHWVRSEGPLLDNHAIDVFSGSCGALTSILCIGTQDIYPPLTGLTIGATYYIRVIGYPPFTSGNDDNEMGLAVVSAPPNDECADAALLPVVTGRTEAYPATQLSTLGATQSQPGCASAISSDDDVWYRFTATSNAHHLPYKVLDYQDPVIQWFSGACGSLTSLVCDGSTASGLTPGQEYHLRLYSAVAAENGPTRLLGDVYESAPNDECAGALPIAVSMSGEGPDEVTVSTWLGTGSTAPCDAQPSDVWLTFTAPTSTVSVYTNIGQDLSLFSGTCGALVCEGEQSTNTSYQIRSFTDLTPGSIYFLKVGTGFERSNVRIRIYATPSNDECATAAPLGVLPGGTGEGFTYGYTCGATPGSTGCGITAPPDVWYTFTATADRHYIHAEPTLANTNMYVEVFGGACGSLTSIFCEEQTNAPDLITGLTPGAEYHLRLFTDLSAIPGTFRVGITNGLANDECPGALELPVLPVTSFMDQRPTYVVDASPSGGSCGNTAKDLWYRFTPTAAEATFLSAYPIGYTTANGVYIELLSGACDNLTTVSCVNNTGLERARGRFTGLVPGTEYHVRYASIWGKNYMVPGIVQRPANDEITQAQAVPRGSNFTQVLSNGSGYGATQSLPTICGSGTSDDDTWYRFTATATSHSVKAVSRNTLFSEENFPFQPVIEVFDTLSLIPDTLEAHNIACGIPGTANLTGLTVGHDYWYRVFRPGNWDIELSVFSTWYTDGDNNEPAGAMELGHGDRWSHFFNTSGATNSLPDADCLMDDTADDDIWFKFTANGSPERVVAGYHTADLTLELFSGTPGNLTSMACSDNVLVLPTLTNGQTYYVRLYSRKNATPVEGRIGLFITPSLTANTCVEETCLGPVLVANPSIEQGEYCLAGFVDLRDTEGIGLTLAPGWPRIGTGSSDGYSSCMPYMARSEMPSKGQDGNERILARSGKGMAGILVKEQTGYREYLQTTLTEPLIPGEPYLVSFHAVLAPSGTLEVNGLGAFLSEGPAIQDYISAIEVAPQVITYDPVGRAGWTNICGVVVPDAPWDHITIGSFFLESTQYTTQGEIGLNAYYFIDDVVVTRVTDPGCVTGIGDVPPLANADAAAGDVLRMYPNPASDRVHIVGDADLFGKRAVIEVFDATGKRMHGEQVAAFGVLQPFAISAEWPQGLYLVMVRPVGGAPRSARLVVRR